MEYVAHNGIFPCFFLGNVLALFFNMEKARISFWRVCDGRITSST